MKNNTKKILFLNNGRKDMVRSRKYNDGVYSYSIYRFSSRFYKAMVKIVLKTKNDFILKLLLGTWALNINNYDLIICEGLKGKKWIFEFLIRNKLKKTKIVMWHWNKIFEKEINPKDVIAQQCEQWSFDPDDCIVYNLKFNTQYFSPNTHFRKKNKLKWDTYFLGTDKDRLSVLIKLKELLEKNNMKTNFHIVNSPIQKKDSRIKYKKPISYKKNIKNVKDSRIIIDVPIYGQRGLTLRVLEALYYKKKLITFNNDLKKEMFYNENNILVLNYEELEDINIANKIENFLNSEYIDTEKNKYARKYFSFEQWMLRFLNYKN